jgi:hypothetical protein
LSWYTIGSTSSYEYDLKISRYSDLSLPEVDLNGGSRLTTNSYSASGLTYGVTYYWAVRAYNPATTTFSSWSTTGSFVTPPAPTSPNIVPNPGSPVAGVSVEKDAQLSWFTQSDESSDLSYDVQISDDPNYLDESTIEIVDLNEKQTLLSSVSHKLENGKMYFWRVRSKAADGTSSYFSESAQFAVIGDVTDVEGFDIIPERFDVSQNYPNPFNPETTIKYAIPEDGFVSIKVYNTLGQEVKTIVNREMTAGIYNVRWNGDDNYGNKVSSGTYFYRVIMGENIMTKKMVLLK